MKGAVALAAAACWLSGCGDWTLPDPRIISIVPDTMASTDAADVIVTVDAVLEQQVHYDTGKITVVGSLLVDVGNVGVGNGRYEHDGMLSGLVPSKLQPGAHDVTVTLSDTRVGVLKDGFTVTPGNWPANGFTIDPIANPQAANVTFAIVIRAQGAFSATFNGTVDYSVEGIPGPWKTTGKLSNGVRTENVTISTPTRGPTHINVIDLLGRIAISNDFNVN